MSNPVIINFKDLYRKHFDDYNQPLFFKSLWHYTSIDGLMGIIRNSSNEQGKLHFWFTRSDCLNDTSEGQHILNLFQKTCFDLLQQNEISQCFYDCIKDAEISSHQFINFPIPPREDYFSESVLDCVPCHAYICSFSLKEDSLDMWRYYSKGNGGYGLKCAPFLFDDYKEYEHSPYKENALFSVMRSFKVIYDNSQKEKILRDIILDTYLAYNNDLEDNTEKASAAKGFLQYALKVFQFQFKHECYASEQEYRFVYYLPYSKPETLKNDMPDVKFRSQNGMVIPYIDVCIDGGHHYLDEILISPYIENKNALATTNEYLSKCGFNCKTRLSELPVRK